jgi:hypothetical protein
VETEAAADEVTIAPTPDLKRLLPDLDIALTGLITLAISKDPMLRPNAAMFGLALDQWCAKQKSAGSPERLQAHLASVFPQTYSPPIDMRAEAEPPKKTVWDTLDQVFRG